MLRKAKKSIKTEKDHSHSSHPKTLSRLKIASGHLLKVIEMVETDEECVDVLQQLSAVISALESSRIICCRIISHLALHLRCRKIQNI